MFASFLDPGRHRRRAAAFLLVAALHAILLFLLWKLGPSAMRLVDPQRGALEITFLPEAREPAPQTRKATEPDAAAAAAAPAPQAAPPRPLPKPLIPVPAAPEDWSFELIPGMEKFDLAEAPRLPGKTGSGSGASESAAADIGGAVPGRERLFPAQWQRKPSRAELSAYLPPGLRQTGFGMIACRTVANFRVEDCEELDQSPGSGLAGAVRQAAWQFRVLPPRVGGRTLVGAWVRIRIDYSEGAPKG